MVGVCGLAAMVALAGCRASGTGSALGSAGGSSNGVSGGMAIAPDAVPAAPNYTLTTEPGVVRQQLIDLTDPSAVVWGTAQAQVIDTRAFPVQVQDLRMPDGVQRRIREMLPPHTRPAPSPPGEPNALRSQTRMSEPRATLESQFSTIDSTGWNPPDPTLAVGPNHVVVTVNSSVAWYTKAGALQFSAPLGSQGNPGFFEPQGAGGFAFDPKCFYDHDAQRYVIVVLEVYTNSAYIDIAVSDDSDPNGVWYKYRTDAVTTVGSSTYWWDYPGAGWDAEAYYVTSNLFGLNTSGFAGAGFRVFNKAPMLTGQPVTFATLRSSDSASVQACEHFGDNPAAYFVSEGNNPRIRVHAITNPTTAPVLHQQSVLVPNYSTAVDAPVLGGGTIQVVGSRIMNCVWRDGAVYAAHAAYDGQHNVARWYRLNMNSWPQSGSWTLGQSGDVDPGTGQYAFFPVITANDEGSVAMTFGKSSASTRVSMMVTGRNSADDPGQMGEPVLVHTGSRSGTSGRWGDYYGIAVDPDGETFWGMGMTDESGIGWDTRVARFTVEAADCPVDINGDGDLNLDDVDAFAAAFFSSDLLADINGDGLLTLDDVDAFVAGFVAGCP